VGSTRPTKDLAENFRLDPSIVDDSVSRWECLIWYGTGFDIQSYRSGICSRDRCDGVSQHSAPSIFGLACRNQDGRYFVLSLFASFSDYGALRYGDNCLVWRIVGFPLVFGVHGRDSMQRSCNHSVDLDLSFSRSAVGELGSYYRY
jgi:hypothetical protein